MKQKQKAFTLIETLLALALGGMILTCATIVLMSFTHIWLNQNKQEDASSHVECVTRFLTTYLQNPPPTASKKPISALTLHILDLGAVNPEPGILFWMPRIPPFLITEKSIRGPILAELVFKKNEGLFLIIKAIPAKEFKSIDLNHADLLDQKVLLSPFVTNMQYGYFHSDHKQWEFGDGLQYENDQRSKPKVPEALKITFQQGRKTKIRLFHIKQTQI